MEIGKIDCGAELILYPVDERIGEIKLKVRPVPPDFEIPADADVKAQLKAIGSLIVGWNFEKDGVVVPCNDETKEQYLWYLVRIVVKGEGETVEPLAGPVVKFATDIENFLGN